MTRPLDLRARRLLRTLIAQHTRDGEPVGSRTLARNSGLDVSPATVRNIMADLEDIGLLSAPHSSAGRVPTDTGYRWRTPTATPTAARTSRSSACLATRMRSTRSPRWPGPRPCTAGRC